MSTRLRVKLKLSTIIKVVTLMATVFEAIQQAFPPSDGSQG